MKVIICIILLLTFPTGSAFAFNCTSLEGAEQRLRDEAFAQPLAAYYLHLYFGNDENRFCNIDDRFITFLNEVYKAQKGIIQYEDLCKMMVNSNIHTNFINKLQHNEGFPRVYRVFNDNHVTFPGENASREIIMSINHDTPYCGKVFVDFFDVLDGAGAEMLFDYIAYIIMYKPEQATAMLPYLLSNYDQNDWGLKNLVLRDNDEEAKQRYSTFIESNPQHSANAHFILNWLYGTVEDEPLPQK